MRRLFCSVMLLVVTGMLSTGCASFQKNRLPRISSLQVSRVGTTATYTFENRVEILGKDFKLTPSSSPLVTSFVATMMECGINCQPKCALSNPDIHMDIKHTWYGGNWAHPLWGFLCGYSLFTIPMWQPQNHSIQATITQTGRDKNIYNLQDGSTTVTWLPMLFAAPFTYSNNQKNPVLPNIYRNLAYRLQQDGYLTPPDASHAATEEPSPIAPVGSAQPETAADKIKALHILLKDGLITEEEYQSKKQKLLSDL